MLQDSPVLTGTAVSQGIAIGPILIYRPFCAVVSGKPVPAAQIPAAHVRYTALLEAAKDELARIERALAVSSPERADIFVAHRDILFDEAIDEKLRAALDSGMAIDHAIDTVYDMFAALLEQSRDALIRERADDVRDIKNRLLRIYSGAPERNLSALTGPAVIAAHDLLPSDAATLDRKNVLAILTEVGGATSHSAIIARGYGIPAMLGLTALLDVLEDGQRVIVDATEGMVLLHPTDEQVAHYKVKMRQTVF